MKQFILLFVFLFTTNLFAQIPTYVPKNGLKSWWGFNGNANDESGNGNNGVVNGPILASDRFGKDSSAYKFRGNADIIGTTTKQVVGNVFSVSFWTQLDSITGAWLIVQGGNQTGLSSSFDLGTSFNSSGILVQYIFTGKQNWIGNDTLFAGANRWYHIVYGQSTSGTKLYINSKLVATNNQIVSNQNLNGYWRFGGYTHQGQNSLFGRIDDIGVWNRELTQNEISDLYNSECSLNIVSQPKSKSSNIGGKVTFNVKSNDIAATIKWQTKVAGLDWMELIEGNAYKNVSSDSLVIDNITLSNHNQLFRSIIDNEVCKDTSEIVSLTVLDTCIAIRTDTVKIIINDTVKKIVNDTVRIGIIDTIKIAVSDTLIIKTKATGIQENKYYTFLIYPNPTNSYVIIDCGDQAEVSSYSFVITNSLGQEKVSSKFTTRFQQIDISGIGGAGLYMISIRDGSNAVIETRKLLIQ